MKRYNSDFILILVTVVIMFLISMLCIGGMFYFKWAELQNVVPAIKIAYQEQMNSLLAPFLLALLLTLGLCIPRRLFPHGRLYAFIILLGLTGLGAALAWGWREALLWILIISAVLQAVVLILAASGRRLKFLCEGYWNRLGSSSVHLGLVLFCMDFFLLDRWNVHLVIFWISAVCIFIGMIITFYAEDMMDKLRSRKKSQKFIDRC
ncbi:MAG: hypothetical protein AVO38_03790 [delta proteobacterium ML8_D]|jgi:hypothetical protein|nr:MAG: hypothetical protein AVO38_03790 [delta proteobacterium ML8_D]